MLLHIFVSKAPTFGNIFKATMDKKNQKSRSIYINKKILGCLAFFSAKHEWVMHINLVPKYSLALPVWMDQKEALIMEKALLSILKGKMNDKELSWLF